MQATQGDWLPARAALHPTGLYFALRDVRSAELQDPFMQETVARVAARESVVHIARGDLGKGTAGTSPAGIVFHVSRCGSTLVSQLLKQHVGLVVYAEPLPVNEILLPPHKWPRAEVVAALRSLGAAFARHARKPYVLKLTSWNTLFCDVVAEAFPDSPWVLCLRDPVEVGVSLLQQPAGWIWDGGEPAAPFRKLIDPEAAATVARGLRRAPLRCVLRRSRTPRSGPRPAGRIRVVAGGGLGDGGSSLLAGGGHTAARAHAGRCRDELQGAGRSAGEVRWGCRGQAGGRERGALPGGRRSRPPGAPAPALPSRGGCRNAEMTWRSPAAPDR